MSDVQSSASPPQPATSTKRKRNDEADSDDGPASTVPKKTRAKSTTTAKPKAKSAAAKGPTPNKFYKDSSKAVEDKVKALDKRVKAMSPNSRAITTDTYADASPKHLPAVQKLSEMDGGIPLAFNLMLAVSAASHTSDLNRSIKMSGYGGGKEPFAKLDDVLLSLIERREKPAARQAELPTVPHRWTQDDADVGAFKTGRPNKQQRGQIERQAVQWQNERREALRSRRDKAEDWVAVALSDLKYEGENLEKYGIDGYFTKSIAALEALMSQ